MSLYPDETLMAYADRQLPLEECRHLEAELAINPALRARLEPFALTGAPLASVYDRPMREPVPERLLAVIHAAGPKFEAAALSRRAVPEAGHTSAAHRAGFLDTIGKMLFPNGLELAHALSIAALLVIGGGAGWMLAKSGSPGPEGSAVAAMDPALQVALDTTPSRSLAERQRAPGGVVPVLSFRSRDGRFCRQYEIAEARGRSVAGVACRGADALWRVAFQVETEGYKTPADSSRPQTAAGASAKALDDAVGALMKGDVLGADDENALIANRWSTLDK